MRTRNALLASLLAASTVATLAQGLDQQSAIPAAHQIAGVNTSTFVAAPPASPGAQGRHANREHPAVAMRREANRLDPNTFIVQPPAHVEWTNPGAAEAQAGGAADPER